MRLSRKISLSCAGVGLALAMIAVAPHRAEANPYFAQQSGRDCAACHQPGREPEGPAGLNPAGLAFLDAYKRCNYQIVCALTSQPPVAPAPTFTTAPTYPQQAPSYPQPAPAYQPAPYYPQAAPTYHYGKAKFEDFCFGNSYFAVRVGGNPNHIVRFKLDLGSKVHIELPDGSTFASQCGGFPSTNGNFHPVTYE
jgi:hypothetical protein